MPAPTSSSFISFQGSQFLVNTYTDDDQHYPSITSLTDGGFVVTWTSDGQDGSGAGIYGQRYASDGSTVGSEFRVNTYTDDNQYYPSVTSLTNGGFVVTWHSRQDGSALGIYGQRYASDGSTVGSEFRVNTYTDDNQYYPGVTSLTDGGFVVTWTSIQGVAGLGIYGQRYAGDGSTVGSEFQVTSSATGFGSPTDPSVTSLTDGGFVVTWSSQATGVLGYLHSNISGQRYASDGSTVGSEFRVDTYWTEDNNQISPSITDLTDGGFVVTWESIGRGIYGQLYASDGSMVGSEFQVSTNTNHSQRAPSVTALTDGGFVVTWASRQDGSGHGIYGQRYASDGSTVGSEFQVNTYTDSEQDSASVTALTNGSFVVTWASYGQDGSRSGIYGQVFDVSSGPTGAVTISGTATEDQTLTAANTLADEDGLGTVTYQWQRDGVDISGATGASYTLTQDDVGAEITVVASYTDGEGTDKSVISAATAAVAYADLWLSGTEGDDRLLGAQGNDIIAGRASADILIGRGGDDSIRGGSGSDTIRGGNGSDSIKGRRDTDWLAGGKGNDEIRGGHGDDELFGRKDHDTLWGGGGGDRLVGGKGDDQLTGRAGADVFAFNGNSGSDTITDFGRGADVIEITSGARGMRGLEFTQVDEDVVIHFANSEVRALDTTIDVLQDADNFLFT